jgi:hypothetical protein
MSSRISSADLRELLSARTTVHTEAIMAKLPIVPPD